MVKTCKKCNVNKPLTDYQLRIDTNRHRSECDSCRSDYNKQRKIKIAKLPKIVTSKKQCSICRYIFNINNFGKLKTSIDGHDKECKLCRKVKSADQYKKHQKNIKAKSNKRYQDNKLDENFIMRKRVNYFKNHEVNKERKRNYNKSERGKQKNREWQALQMKTNPMFRFKKNLRSRVGKIYKKAEKQKHGSSLFSISKNEKLLINQLESLFAAGMTRQNYGKGHDKWCIDHYVPLSHFDPDNEEHFKIANHYLNLRPLWNRENEAKNDTLPLDFKEIIETIKKALSE